MLHDYPKDIQEASTLAEPDDKQNRSARIFSAAGSLIICRITPKWVVLEGTEGCKGYKDYMYHFKGFLIGCVYTLIMAVVITGVDYLILRFLIWK